MKKQIIASLLVAAQAQAVLDPASSIKSAPTNDPYIGYQWSLMPADQTAEADWDDTHSTGKIHVNPAFSIGWKNLDAQMKREVIVGIIDSGINNTHADLKDRVLKGFNFVAKSPAQEALVNDDFGHGTHLAGIMAANINNQIGIAGLSNKIKILPLKIYDKSETNSSAASKREPMTNRVAKAIDYAIENKADILLLSMGWPRIANTDLVKAAFKKAIDAGIVIVAAAGNDGHNGQIYPCAYQNVVCVAAMGLDGTMSSFTNRGGHVDIAAPGEEILSLWPQVLDSDVFGISGYNIRNGNSQSAPFVAATAAVLRGMFPDESSKQIRARILLSSRAWDSRISFGSLQFEKATQVDPDLLLQPIFKGVENAQVNKQSGKFSIPLTIEKGSAAATPQVQVTSERSDIRILGLQKKSDQAGGMTEYEIQAQASNISSHNKFTYTVEINGRKFSNEILLQTSITDIQHTRAALTYSNPKMAESGNLLTVYNPRNNSDIMYWSFLKQDNGLLISVWKLTNGQFVEKSVLLPEISGAYGGFNLTAEDYDMDGKTDFMIPGVIRDAADKIKSLQLFYLDQDLNITRNFTVEDNGGNSLPRFQNKADISFMKISKPGMKPLKVPMYWDVGFIPDEDKNPNFGSETDERWRRPYYLEPVSDTKMVTRTLSNNGFAEMIRDELKVSVLQDIDVLATDVQSTEDAIKGRTNLVFSVGRGVTSQVYMMPIDDLAKPLPGKNNWTLLQGSASIYLGSQTPTEIYDLSRGRLENALHFQAGYSLIAAQMAKIKGNQIKGSKIGLPDRTDRIADFARTYMRGNDQITFFFTGENVNIQGQWNSRSINEKTMIYRSSFLPGQSFGQKFTPVVISAQQNPGLLVSNGNIFSNTILTYSLDANGKLVSPISRTLELPANCEIRNALINTKNYSRVPFLCKQAGKTEILFIDLE